ncbi:hypothetical protein [Saccharothrix saharensis]|uniref:hypothetical protein n=1 Tax=Saccharothrix saharensis TaxID=571190 RepID=UPI001FE2DA94|nr:hypothetical protein [Saccharothrix saharensis]
MTRKGCRTVLVVVPHVTAGTRLADLLQLLSGDQRLQVVFTVPSMADAWHGADEYVRRWDGVVLPWEQVVRMRFDLALAASFQQIHRIQAPVVLSPHGVGLVKSRLSPWDDRDGEVPPTLGLSRELVVRDGRIVPAALLLTHEAELARLRDSCPEAVPRAVIAGDLCFDRLRVSRPLRTRYREALGVRRGQQLVVVSSTWSSHSLLGSESDLVARLTTDLPADRYRVVTAVHPLVWALHGSWQVRSWFADYLDAGHALLPPEDGWRAAVVAADAVIGDHGSVTVYAAALGVPVLMNRSSARDEAPGSVASALRRLAHALDDRDLTRQLREVRSAHRPGRHAELGALVTSRPGQAAALVRRTAYEILRLPEPARPAPVQPVPLPVLLSHPFAGGLGVAC